MLTPRVVPFAVERPALEDDLRRDQTGVKMLTRGEVPAETSSGGRTLTSTDNQWSSTRVIKEPFTNECWTHALTSIANQTIIRPSLLWIPGLPGAFAQ